MNISWQTWLLAARPKTLPAAVIPVLLGTALAAQAGGFRFLPALVCFVFALLIQIGTNFANDYFDFKKGADTPDRIGPTRAVASGLIPAVVMLRATVLVLGVAFLVGLVLVFYGGVWLLLVGGLSILCALAYTGGPFPLGYNGLGDIFVFIFFGLVAVMFTYYVQAGTFTWASFWVGVGCGLMSNNILVINNARDIKTDREAGKLTLPARFGLRFAVVQYGLSVLVACAVPDLLVNAGFSPWVFMALLVLPMGVILTLYLANARTATHFDWLLMRTAQLLIAYGLLLSLGIVL